MTVCDALRARALALQLLQREKSRLHPELELVWEELGLRGGGVDR